MFAEFVYILVPGMGPFLACFFLALPFILEACTVRVDSVNCTLKEITNVHYTCESSYALPNCFCTFDNPLEIGWHKMCNWKNDLKPGKKVRKRQVLRRNNCEAIQPPRPGRARCMVSRGEIVCRGVCNNGFRFVDGEKEHSLSCRFAEGVWTPDKSYPGCEPECIPPCQNGGKCTAPKYCACPDGYRGSSCEYELELCGISKIMRVASSWQCNYNRKGTSCDISCYAPGTLKAETEKLRYVCTVDGRWTPSLPLCVLANRKCGDPGTIDFGQRIAISPRFHIGTTVFFQCNEGYMISGSTNISCQTDGRWTAAKPECKLVPFVTTARSYFQVSETKLIAEECPKPNAPDNSIVQFSFPNHTALQTLLNLDLPIFQHLHITLKEEANSSVSSSRDLGNLPKGLFQVGTRVHYKCRSRFYKLYGSEYQTCLSSLTWSGYQPSCIPQCGKSDSPKAPFIVNGNKSLVGQWPWMVALALKGTKDLKLICGGVLISERWVLTAAHCVTRHLSNIPIDVKALFVFCGKYYRDFQQDNEDVQVKQVRHIIVHDEYDFIHYDVDIALLQLEDGVDLNTRVQPICLPTEVTTRDSIRDGENGLVLGWGLTENGTYSETLRETTLPVVSHTKCEKAYRQGLRTVTITQNMFCAGHESSLSDTCIGDSGGPFMFSFGPATDKRWYLEGLVSWGSESGCAIANRYSGFTKVGQFVPWINMFI